MVFKEESSSHEFKAYVSEPITRCPLREKGRIQTLIGKMKQALAAPPYATKLYVPSEVTAPDVRTNMKPEHVYILDRIRVVEADYMLVIGDHTSFGIGGEVEIATALGKPVVIFSRSKTLSRFLTGTPANAVRAMDDSRHYLHYHDWRDLKPKLLPVIERILNEPATRVHLDIPFWDGGKQLRDFRKKRGLTVEELARKTGLRVPHLRFLETSLDEIRHELETYQDHLEFGPINLVPYQLEQLTNIGLPVLHKLAVALDVPVGTLMDAQDSIQSPKGPLRESANKINRISRARSESLKARASQYDVTFREYEKLQSLLVDRFIQSLARDKIKLSRKHQLIQEREFLDALASVRGGLKL